MEYDKQIRKIKTRNSECENDDESGKKDPNKIRRKKVKKDDEEDDDIITNLSAEKQAQCALILEELNRKMQMVTWKPS